MKLKKMCRTCLCLGEVMFPFFDEIEELTDTGLKHKTAVELLETLTFVQIHKKDYLPDHICARCLNEIQRAYSFTLKCKKTEMILSQLKEVKVNLRKLKEFPNRHVFGRESNCQLTTVKEEKEESLELIDHENCVIKDFHVTFKNEPELNIEDISCSDNELKAANGQLKFPAYGKEVKSVDMFQGQKTSEHIDEKRRKLCNEDFACTQHPSVTHLPTSSLDEITQKKTYSVSEDLRTQSVNIQSAETYCQHCSQHFTNFEMLKLHNCPRMLVNRSTDYNEEIEHKKQKPHQKNRAEKSTDLKSKYKCNICFKVFSYSNNFIYHMLIHTGDKNHLEQYMRAHSGEKLFHCTWCSKKFRYKPSMVRHNQMMHAEELANKKPKYKCRVCSESFRYERNLVTHMHSHPEEKQNVHVKDVNEKLSIELPDFKQKLHCNACLKRFRYNSQLIRHMRCHTYDKPVQCKLCSENFGNKQLLRAHTATDHINTSLTDKPKIECTFCFQAFTQSWNLNKHMRMRSTANMQCKICLEKFCSSRMVAVHMKTKHLNELPDVKSKNQCSRCSKGFTKNYQLISHIRTHTGEKPFQCKLCSNTFQYKHLLRVHMESKHLNELPGDRKPRFQCNICSKIFAFNNNLVRHMRSHTGEKPYQCEVCTEKFRYEQSLFRHLQTHYKDNVGNEQNFQCGICSKVYTYKILLSIHMKTKHGSQLPE